MRALLILALASIGLATACGRSAEGWRAELASSDPFESGLAALALARVAPAECEDALPKLLDLLDSRRGALRLASRASLKAIGRHHADALLASYIDVDQASQDFRSGLREALVAAGERAVDPIREKLLVKGASNPRELGQILADIGAPAVDGVIADLAHSDRRKRLYAAWILGRMGTLATRALPALQKALLGDELSVARPAALALAEIEPLGDAAERAIRSGFERHEAALDPTLREALAELVLNRAELRAEPAPERQLFALGAEALGPVIDACASKHERRVELGLRVLHGTFARLAFGFTPARFAPLARLDQHGQLMALLDNELPRARGLALIGIASFGARAEPELGVITERLRDAHAGVACCARLALAHVVRCVVFEAWRRAR